MSRQKSKQAGQRGAGPTNSDACACVERTCHGSCRGQSLVSFCGRIVSPNTKHYKNTLFHGVTQWGFARIRDVMGWEAGDAVPIFSRGSPTILLKFMYNGWQFHLLTYLLTLQLFVILFYKKILSRESYEFTIIFNVLQQC